MFKVIKNTYPKHNNVAHAEPGDIVEWIRFKKWDGLRLVRVSDYKTVFSAPKPRNVNGDIVDDQPTEGVIGHVKSKGYVLIIEKVEG